MEAIPCNGGQSRQTGQLSQRIVRHQLLAYLNVYNSHTGQFMGSMGNVSCNGFMLISPLPVMLGVEYQLQLHLPATAEDKPQILTFRAISRWCRADLTPGHYDAGFSRVDDSPVFASLADALRDYFTFVHPIDA